MASATFMIRDSGSVHGPVQAVPPTRKSLLLRIKNWSDEGSWTEFSKIYEKLIYETALRSGLRPVEAQEVVQETLLTVAKKIAGFDYDPNIGSFKGWLLQITRRRIIDQLRKRRPQVEQAKPINASSTAETLLDPASSRLEALWNEEWHQALLSMARALVKRRVGLKQYRMFELYVLQQVPIKSVTSSLGVTSAQVYMAKYRITRLLKKELKNLEKEL
jgi:RNA polymerase sigma-70 factor (ECF subfamily)